MSSRHGLPDGRQSGLEGAGLFAITEDYMNRFSIVMMALLVAGCVAHVARPRSSNESVGVSAQSQSPLAGVWKVLELSSRAPGADWTIATPPHLSLYIFTAKHYSYMFAPGAGPRRLFAGGPDQPSEAEKLAAYHSIVAGSGTYSLEGTTLR